MLSTVAISGSYSDLINVPSIPAAQVQCNWSQSNVSSNDFIKNKPVLSTVAISGSYSDLINVPSKASFSQWTTSGSNIYYGLGSSNIGIGTSNPLSTLDISGSLNVKSMLTVGGNLGIGTTSPTCALDVSGGDIKASTITTTSAITAGGAITANGGINGPLSILGTCSVASSFSAGLITGTAINIGSSTTTNYTKLQVMTSDFGNPGNSSTVTTWNSAFATVGPITSPTSGALGFAYSSTYGSIISSVAPNTAWKPMVLNAANYVVNVGPVDIASYVSIHGNTGQGTWFGSASGMFFGGGTGLSQWTGPTFPVNSFGLYVNYSIMTSQYFVAASDSRIKEPIEGAWDDLTLINNLTVRRFAYKDKVRSVGSTNVGFFAQEVQRVFPEAVTSNVGVIPDIQQVCNWTGSKIEWSGSNISIGDTLNLVNYDGSNGAELGFNSKVVDVSSGNITIDSPEKLSGSNVFVYGHQVNDFLGIAQDMISASAISAIQQLSQKVDRLEAEINILKSRI